MDNGPTLGPHSISWHPDKDCPDVKAWIKRKGLIAHPGWIFKVKADGSVCHEKDYLTEDEVRAFHG